MRSNRSVFWHLRRKATLLWLGPLLALMMGGLMADPSSAHPSGRSSHAGSVEVRSTGVARSANDQKNSIFRLYWAYFLRNPDDAGSSYWVGRLDQGTSLSAISSSFAASSEFKHRYGQLDNQAFVRLAYSNVFSRDVDSSGLTYWSGKLDSGTSRGNVMLGFSQSGEFRRITNTGPGLCDSPQQCSTALFFYWQAGNQHARTLAGFIAIPSAVSYLFGHTYNSSAGWQFSSCSGVVCRATRTNGGTMTMTMANSGAPYIIGSVVITGATSTPPPTSPPATDHRCDTAESCALKLRDYWIARDQQHALQIASSEAVTFLFQYTHSSSTTYWLNGCTTVVNDVACSESNSNGWTYTTYMHNTGAPFFIYAVTRTRT